MHLVDSPGHVDFTGEVEAALRVCDGGILVVDVVEGVCVQTVTVLRAALEHAVRPVLVLNKIDRLFVELSLSPMEAYRHIQMVIEQVNVIMGVREVEQMMEEATLRDGAQEQSSSDWTLDESVTKGGRTESGFFSPELGNVAFASAVDGWAFRITDFAKIFFQSVFGISERVLQRTLWGDYYLQQKTKRIARKKASEVSTKAEPMFSKFIMASIHAVYDGVLSTQNDPELALKKRIHISEKLGLKLSKRDLKHRDTSVVLHAIMSAWLPAARVLLDMVAEKLPTAVQAQANSERLAVIWPHHTISNTAACDEDGKQDLEKRKESFSRQHQALKDCASEEGTPVLAVVTKMIEGPSAETSSVMDIRQPKPREENAAKENACPKPEAEKASRPKRKENVEESGQMIAFARVLCGTIKVGMKLYVYGPKYKVAADGTFDESTVSEATVTNLHLLMGRSTDNLRAVSAGSIVGIGGVDEAVLKTATLSSEPPGLCLPAGLSFAGTGLQRDAVVRVAVEPHLPTQLPVLQAGLRKLNQSDPSVETMVTSSGEYIVAASGELHLERCLKDLREKFAKGISIHVSKPIASFRETVVGGASSYVDDENEEKKSEDVACENNPEIVRETKDSPAEHNLDMENPSPFLDNVFMKFGRFVTVSNSEFSFRVYAAPLPTHLSNALDSAGATARAITQGKDLDIFACHSVREKIERALKKDAADAKSNKTSAEEFESFWLHKLLPCVWACGPRRFGSNLLVGPRPSSILPEHLKLIFANSGSMSSNVEKSEKRLRELESAIATGFQLGAQAGPLAEEPMHGVAIFIDNISLKSNGSETPILAHVPNEQSVISTGSVDHLDKMQTGSVSGLAIGAMKERTRKAVLQSNARLMEAVLHVDISVTSDALGGTYTVIGKRRGRVLDEQMRDGVNIFGIEALIPVVESFGFADLVRKQTSGFAVPQMVFSHWETIEIDPFWEPRTEEELEDLGVADATAENNNLARKLMNSVRRRKGLKVEEKIVEKAEKQRTLSKKK